MKTVKPSVIEEFNLEPSVYIVRKAIQFLIPLLYLLISISFYLRTYDSAQVKITLLQMGGLSIVALWISLLFLEGKKSFTKEDFVFLAPFICYLIYIIFSFINVPYKEWALDDFLRYTLYSFISLIVIREFDISAINRLTKFLIISTWIVVAYGIIQWIDVNFFPPRGVGTGIDPFIWRGAFANRIFSTYGNPNFFANYMVLMLPIIISRLLKTKNISLAFLAICDIFCIINTYTKGAWIGFGISTLIFVAIYIYYFTEFDKKIIRWIYFILIIIGMIVTVGVVNYAAKKSLSSVPFRVATWLSTWEMIETHPVIGSGVGSFRPLYPAYRRPIIFHIEGRHNTETDHAENEHLEQLLDNGIIGAGIFYWMIIFVTVTGLRAIRFTIETREKEKAYDLLGYLVAFLGMLIHNFTDVSMRFVSSGVYLGLLPAVIINLSRGHALWEFHYMGTDLKNKIDEEKKNLIKILLGITAIIVIIWLAIKIIYEFSQLQGDVVMMKETGDIILYSLSWVILLFLCAYIAYVFSKIILKSFNIYVSIISLIFFMPISFFPVYYFWGWFKADVNHNMAIFFSKQGKWDEALGYYQKVVKYNSTFIMPYYFMGNVFTDRFDMRKQYREEWGDKNKVLRDDFERAFEMYEKVRSLAPNYVQMHHQVGVLYMKMAEYMRVQGKMEEALKYLDKAMNRFELYQNLDPVFAYNYLRRAQVWIFKNNFKKAEQEYLNYLNAWRCNEHNFLSAQKVYGKDHQGTGMSNEYKPKDIYPHLCDVYTNLANLYFIQGDIKKSYENYLKALNINPEYEPAKRNIQAAKARLGIK
ncbi:MAG: O-antigen ligase family protein [Elusimicrobiota bacterium]